MRALKARVENGRLTVVEPVDLPEGTVVDLSFADSGDDLDDAERAALHDALERAWESAQSGKGRRAAEVLEDLGKAR